MSPVFGVLQALVPVTIEVEVPFDLHRFIIGQKGVGIRKMMDEFEVSLFSIAFNFWILKNSFSWHLILPCLLIGKNHIPPRHIHLESKSTYVWDPVCLLCC